MYNSPEERWAAVQARDPAAHSAFVYAVITTRIYCRPTCPARLARRANVIFFDGPADAAAASYRPCKRCKPDELAIVSRAAKMVEAAQSHIRDRNGNVTLDQLAEHLDISPRYLHHIFTKSLGCTPAAYGARFKTKPLRSPTQIPEMSIGGDSSNSSSVSPMSRTDELDGLNSLHQHQSNSSNGQSPGPWMDLENLENLDIFTSSLTREEADMLWQTYDQSQRLGSHTLGQDGLWTGADFDNILLDQAQINTVLDTLPMSNSRPAD